MDEKLLCIIILISKGDITHKYNTNNETFWRKSRELMKIL